MYIPRDLINLIDQTIAKDQGAAFRGHLGRILPHMGDVYRDEEESHRSHLGASILGRDCGRDVWYSFHWTTKASFEGRMLRLFNRGHIEEARFIAMLMTVGSQVYQQDEQGKQFRIQFGNGHGGGSGDGIGVNIPFVNVPALLECKTHNERSFTELAGSPDDWRAFLQGKGPFKGKGLKEGKFEHYVQAQLYMRRMQLTICLYMAVNKNTDDLFIQIVELDPETADQFIERGEKLIYMPTPPKKISESPGFWKCRFCDHRPTCHMRKPPDINCRTCQHSKPTDDGLWTCAIWSAIIPKDVQLAACEKYQVSDVYR